MFEGGRVSLGVQNRPQEVPNEPKTSETRANEAPKSAETILQALLGRSKRLQELPS